MGRWGAGWAIFLAGLPFASFLDRRVDFWHAQTAWAQAWILLLLCVAISRGLRVVANPPLAAFLAWGSLTWAWAWHQTMATEQVYNALSLMPLAHLWSLAAFYVAACTLCTRETLTRLLRWVALAGVVSVAYGYLQWANLDQFMRNIDPFQPDVIVGLVGNSSHYAAFLVLLLPLWLVQRTWWAWGAAAGALGLLALTNSLGAWLALGAMGLVLGWRQAWWWGAGVMALLLGVVIATLMVPEWRIDQGRFRAWAVFWEAFTKRPITGWGLGWVADQVRGVADITNPTFQWRHVHNAYLQVAVQQGVIGLSLLGWGLVEVGRRAWRLRTDPLAVTLAAVFAAFAANCTVNFADHLWVTAALGLMAYCGLYVLSATVEPV